jgi:hypothetical protein
MSSFAVAAAIQKKLKITGVNRIDVLIESMDHLMIAVEDRVVAVFTS